MVWPSRDLAGSVLAPRILPELRSVLHPGGGFGRALHRGFTRWNSGPRNPSNVYVGWYHSDGLSEAQSIPSG